MMYAERGMRTSEMLSAFPCAKLHISMYRNNPDQSPLKTRERIRLHRGRVLRGRVFSVRQITSQQLPTDPEIVLDDKYV